MKNLLTRHSSRRVSLTVAATGLLLMLVSSAGCDSKTNSETSAETQEPTAAEESADNESPDKESADNESTDKESAEHSDSHEAKEKKADLPEDMPAGATKHFGAEFQTDADPITLATAMEKYADKDKQIKVAANIKKVCKKKGCWFTLAADGVDRKVRVRMKDYGFFIPRNTDGAEVVVEGKLERRTMTEKEAKHYAKDEGRDPSSIDKEDLKVFEFTASGVQITRES